MNAKSLQLCPTPWDSMDCSLPGSSVHGFSRQENRVGCHAFFQETVPNQGLNPGLMSPVLQAGSLPLAPSGKPEEENNKV